MTIPEATFVQWMKCAEGHAATCPCAASTPFLLPALRILGGGCSAAGAFSGSLSPSSSRTSMSLSSASMASSALSLMVVVLGLTITAAVTGREKGVGGLLAPLDPDLILSQSGPGIIFCQINSTISFKIN